MTYAFTTHAAGTDHERVARATAPVALGVLTAGTALTVYGAHDIGEIAIVLAVLVVAVGGVYGFLLPRLLRRESAGGTALTLSVAAAALLVPAFWSALPLALGAAGAMLGYAGRNAARGSGTSVAAVVVGSLAAFGYFAVYALDTLSQLGVSWA